MVTITINERTKAGKMLLELASLLAKSNKGVSIEAGLNKPTAYDPVFVEKIKQSEKEQGREFSSTADLWGSINNLAALSRKRFIKT